MEGLLTKEIKESLEKVISHCFYANRILDRICSVLSVSFVMPITSNILHHKLAHRYPILADVVSDYMDSRDCTTIYGETVKGDQEYENYLECFNKVLEINLELEKLIKDSIELALKIGDYTTKVYLEKFLLDITPITKDILFLVDKAEMYGDNETGMMRFDHDITDFNIFAG